MLYFFFRSSRPTIVCEDYASRFNLSLDAYCVRSFVLFFWASPRQMLLVFSSLYLNRCSNSHSWHSRLNPQRCFPPRSEQVKVKANWVKISGVNGNIPSTVYCTLGRVKVHCDSTSLPKCDLYSITVLILLHFFVNNSVERSLNTYSSGQSYKLVTDHLRVGIGIRPSYTPSPTIYLHLSDSEKKYSMVQYETYLTLGGLKLQYVLRPLSFSVSACKSKGSFE